MMSAEDCCATDSMHVVRLQWLLLRWRVDRIVSVALRQWDIW
jgi:hypothetical protein